MFERLKKAFFTTMYLVLPVVKVIRCPLNANKSPTIKVKLVTVNMILVRVFIALPLTIGIAAGRDNCYVSPEPNYNKDKKMKITNNSPPMFVQPG